MPLVSEESVGDFPLLFQPHEDDQCVLNDYADCLAVRTLLHISDVKFKIERRKNAEFMSPTGKTPFLKHETELIADFGSIHEYSEKKFKSLINSLTAEQKGDMQANIALIEDVLVNVELYINWIHQPTLQRVTKPRYAIVYPWPLNAILPRIKASKVKGQLADFGWANKTVNQVLLLLDKVCRSLSSFLGEKTYFMGDDPSPVDALAFGHLYTILTTELPEVDMAGIVKRYQNLIDFVQNIEKEFFSRN